MIDLTQTMQTIDEYFAGGDVAMAQKTMEEALAEAVREGQEEALLPLLNELMGCYRETSQVEASYRMAEQALKLVDGMGLAGSTAGATTFLNAANVYRAGGSWENSLACYERAGRTYEALLSPDDMLVASYHNNISLLYQEMGQYDEAKRSLLRALSIARLHPEAVLEEAVTCANLAATCVELGEEEEAESWADLAINIFEKNEIKDAHYMAALSARGSGLYKKGRLEEAASFFRRAMEGMEELFGRNEFYTRLEENYRACTREVRSGLELSRAYYRELVAPMLHERFAEWEGRIAAGLAGEGSDCFGWDDAYSRDHDWGPDVCLWVSRDIYQRIGRELEEAYGELPDSFRGETRRRSAQGTGRRGVQITEDFFKRLVGAEAYEEIDWRQASDAGLAAAVNGEIFRDDEGRVSEWREALSKGYPENIRLIKMAEAAASFSQSLQYNLARAGKRGDHVSAAVALGEGIANAMKLALYIEGIYPAHAKGMWRQLTGRLSSVGAGRWRRLCADLELLADPAARREKAGETEREEQERELIGRISAILWEAMAEEGLIVGEDLYLDTYAPQLLWRAAHVNKTCKELAQEIAEAEFRAFQNVSNKGGRADCQDDWNTFSIMRQSQYLTWPAHLLLRYLQEFVTEYQKGHNLIEEKYARMMESTAPEEYAALKRYLPGQSERTKEIINAIAEIQVGWMESFAADYPALAANARSIRAKTDSLFNTSYETYLRGELGTYSPLMLKLYGSFIAECARSDRNLAKEAFENSVGLYGYASLEEAERLA